MDPQLLALSAAALVAVAVLFLWLGRRLAGATAAEKAELERQLAVALNQAGRLPALEARADTLAVEKSERERLHAHEAALAAERALSLRRTEEALQQARQDADALRSNVAALTETLAQERQQADEKLALLAEAREGMAQQFKLLAAEVMKEHGETYAKKNFEQLDGVLNPLRLGLVEFKQSLQAAHTESEKERVRLAEQIKALSETSARMSTETQTLTQALRGKSQTQGAWGEMILATILQKSGLREGDEYVVQASHTNDEGDRLRPDVIVRLPNEQSIVIDAKVSLTAYSNTVAAETEEERAAHLRAHVASLRMHVKTLASKEYHKHAPGALDYVVMFVPIEGALAAALNADPGITADAVENSVYIATPTTLMIALRTAANVWHVERRNRNAEEIATRAGRIYDKVVLFMDNMEGLGKALDNAHRQYERAVGQLSRGKGNVLRQLEDLKRLGAKTAKSLPPALLDDAGTPAVADDAEAPAVADDAEAAE